MVRIEKETVTTTNKHQLSATYYRPEGEVIGAVLIAPAMGVTQKYYAAFAEWLATQSYLVVTFDYYGVGLSQTSPLRDTDVTVIGWAEYDCSAILTDLSNKIDGKPLFWIGHSLGGQILGLVPNNNVITKVITIACGSGYWQENVASLKWKAGWLWYVVVPVATRLFGYFPGKALRKVGNLPKGVMCQWRSWCLHPEYLLGVEDDEVRKKYSNVKMRITSFSFTDDEMMSDKNIASIHDYYTASEKIMHRLNPEQIGVEHIGHFGFFKDKFKKILWEKYLLSELQAS